MALTADLERELAELREEVRTLRRQLARTSQGPSPVSEQELLRLEAERISHVGSWVWNVTDDSVVWSDELFRILGYDPEVDRASTAAFFAHVHPDDVDRVAASSQEGIRTGIAQQVDLRLLLPDGAIRHVHMTGAMVFDADGALRQILGTVIDQTSVIEAAATKFRADHLLREIENIASLGVVDVNLVTGDRRWSPGVRRILGLADDVDPSMDAFLARVHPADRHRLLETRAVTMTSDETQVVEYRILRPDGETRHVRGLGSPRIDEHGTTIGLISLIFDVTEQRLLQQTLDNAAKLEAIGRLAGGVAHDVNNQMMVVATIAELIQDVDPSSADTLRSVVDSASRLTRPLLSVSGKAQLDIKAIDCADLVANALAQAQPMLGANIEVVAKLMPEQVLLDVDAHELEQALLNLLINARDALADGGRITVRTRLIRARLVEISIEDSGSGVSDEIAGKVFEPFFTTKAPGRGTGLGLALVKTAVERHAGTIELHSDPATGTRISIRLPCRVAAEPDREERASTPTTSRPLRVLVLDDDHGTRGAIRSLLEASGHSVLEASLPSEAVAALADVSPAIDLLVCDLVMPEMLGPAMIEALRDQNLCPPRVIYVTGYGASASSMITDADVLLFKPFNAERLREAITRTEP